MPGSPVCVDASFVLGLLTSKESDAPAVLAWKEWHELGRSLVAPTLLHYEIANALRRYVVHGELTEAEAAELLDVALSLDISLYEDEELHRRALQIANEFSLPATYDSHYLALSERLKADFWTADKKLARRVGEAFGGVHLLQS